MFLQLECTTHDVQYVFSSETTQNVQKYLKYCRKILKNLKSNLNFDPHHDVCMYRFNFGNFGIFQTSELVFDMNGSIPWDSRA